LSSVGFRFIYRRYNHRDLLADFVAGWDIHIGSGVENPVLYSLMYGGRLVDGGRPDPPPDPGYSAVSRSSSTVLVSIQRERRSRFHAS
jgi:hypothetical protein